MKKLSSRTYQPKKKYDTVSWRAQLLFKDSAFITLQERFNKNFLERDSGLSHYYMRFEEGKVRRTTPHATCGLLATNNFLPTKFCFNELESLVDVWYFSVFFVWLLCTKWIPSKNLNKCMIFIQSSKVGRYIVAFKWIRKIVKYYLQ